ncbi:MAG: NUDIX domain-containing protein [Gaiellales bacterium]|nr:NUDIX domain-containing protein [Gaiellales bacterium]
MPKNSAGILLYRQSAQPWEVMLVHPGGPLWAKRDTGAWSVPKGEMEPGEEPQAAAVREFREETGVGVHGDFLPLHPVRYSSGKMVHAWAVQMDLDPARVKSNEFELQWPPRSGRYISVPEVDRAGWFSLDQARLKIVPAQAPLLDELESLLSASGPGLPGHPCAAPRTAGATARLPGRAP